MGASIKDWRTEYRVAAEAVDARTEKMLGTADSLLAAVDAKDTHDSRTTPSSGAGGPCGASMTVSFAMPGKILWPVGGT
jgi:hypothetical protein